MRDSDLMTNVKMFEQECYEDIRKKAESLISNILYQADYFEMRTRIKPTIFMSHDVFSIIVRGTKDCMVERYPKNQTAWTLRGYDLELFVHGSRLLYVGYSIADIIE